MIKQIIDYIVWVLFILILLFGCKTVKEVVKIETKYDSTAIKENKALRLFLSEEVERFEKERETWEKTGVTFFPDGHVFTDSMSAGNLTIRASDPPLALPSFPTKIIFDNGKIKSIEGRVKSLNQSLYEKSSELLDAHSTIDSMGVELEKAEVELSKKESAIYKDKKVTVMPWWIWLLLAVGWIGRGYWPKVKKYLSLIKL